MLSVGDQFALFESAISFSDIFYDNINQKVITVKGEGIVEVNTVGTKSNEVKTYRLKIKNKLRLIKFSANERLCCVQYNDTSVEFINLSGSKNEILSSQFVQSVKSRSARIVGLEWVENNQVLIITNQGLELYQVNAEKKNAKLLKTHHIILYCFVYHPPCQLLIVSNGVNGALLNLFSIQNANIYRLSKFQVDFVPTSIKQQLIEREITVAPLYNELYIIVLRPKSKNSQHSDFALYKIDPEGVDQPVLTHILHLGMVGAFALHILNNVIVVHHQDTRSSFVFDIELQTNDSLHYPILEVELECSTVLSSALDKKMPLYSSTWVMFQPNYIIDANYGVFTELSLQPLKAEKLVANKFDFLRFLYNRNQCPSSFLELLKQYLISNELNLKQISAIFERIAKAISDHSKPVSKRTESSAKFAVAIPKFRYLLIEQQDVFGSIFLLPDDYSMKRKKRFLSYMLRFLSALEDNDLEPQPYFLNEILVPMMITTGQIEQLYHLLLYRVIADSKQLAFQLLAHEAKYPPLVQLALDMLSRVGNASEEIVEVLIARGFVVEAIRYLENTSLLDRISALKLLECAWKENRQIRFAAFSYFRAHSSKLRPINFATSEQFELFARKFKELFSDGEIEAMNQMPRHVDSPVI